MSVATASEMRRRLRVRYGRTSDAVKIPEHAVLFEIPVDGVYRMKDGHVVEALKRRQRIDAVAVGLWQRTNHLVHGFEIKVSRSDLLSVLREPDKAACAFALVDRWWLVLGDPALLRDGDDLPAGWGVLVARGRGLGVLVEAEPAGSQHGGRFIAAMVQTAVAGRGGIAHGLGRVEGYHAGWKRGYQAGQNQASSYSSKRRTACA